MRASRSEFIEVRQLRYHVRRWGAPDAPAIVLLHGWMDVSASFQFLADCLPQWQLIAPDWRGFGLTECATDTFWFPEYLADLDAILDHYCGPSPVNLCGHSLGGNIAMLYAGVRPERVRRVINLEGIGLPPVASAEAPRRYAQWLKQLSHPPALASYASLSEVATRLQKNNRRLSRARAEFLASFWSARNAQGRWEILAHPAHKVVSPVLYRAEEVTACWAAISAPVLWLEAEDSLVAAWPGNAEDNRSEVRRRMASVASLSHVTVADAGHMLHHDQPQSVAQAIDQFCGNCGVGIVDNERGDSGCGDIGDGPQGRVQ